MVFPSGTTKNTTFEAACQKVYDVVIVGSGISGAIIAHELAKAHKSVLILEAGPGEDLSLATYESYLRRFYGTASKDNQAPFPLNPNAPMPRGPEARKVWPGRPETGGYLVQNGPFSSDTTYTRVVGGTTMHWEAKVLRMLPEDFEMRSRFGRGADWPVNYKDLEPYYELAEREIGVSANVEDQAYLGLTYRDGYVFPMQGLPLSYLDTVVNRGIQDTTVELDGQPYNLKVRPFPQGRNGIPNPLYDNKNGFVPIGAVSTTQVELGERCQGNNNCVPLCPVQAKYHAGKTLAQALRLGSVSLLSQAVASKVQVREGRVAEIEIKYYRDPAKPVFHTGTVRGKVFVLCANAIENARLMLQSELPSRSGLVGRNLMDHAYLLNWGLMPERCGTMRGTNSTAGIVELRGGSFRRSQAAFSVDIHNDGWGWATGAPYSDLAHLVDDQNRFGCDLRRELAEQVTRQLLLASMIEVLPSESNRVTVDPRYTDALGNLRPVISYDLSEYTLRGAAYARQFARLLFQRLGATDHTSYDPDDYGYVTYEGEGYVIRGGNHLAGTHVMGTSPSTSVVDTTQRSWDHDNLYLVGGGSLPTIATANVTLTIAALCFKTASAILQTLNPSAVHSRPAVGPTAPGAEVVA